MDDFQSNYLTRLGLDYSDSSMFGRFNRARLGLGNPNDSGIGFHHFNGYSGLYGYNRFLKDSPYINLESPPVPIADVAPTVTPTVSPVNTPVVPSYEPLGLSQPSVDNLTTSPAFKAGYDSVLGNRNSNTWTASDWSKIAGTGVQLLGSLGSLWMQNKGYKLAKQQMADQTALNRANYRMQAKAWNNSQRDIASGRGLAVMSSSQKSALGRQARGRLVEESY